MDAWADRNIIRTGIWSFSAGALVVDVTRPEERGPALGFFTAFIEVGIVVGAMGLGFITEILGYANMFALSGIIVLVITLAFWLLVQQRHTIKLEGE